MTPRASTTIYHASAWRGFSALTPGAEVVLLPGPQGAEGAGVYFAEEIRVSASDSCYLAGGAMAVFAIQAEESDSAWWRTKKGLAKKFGKPRTWHTAGRKIALRVLKVHSYEGIPLYECTWAFAE
jgi:hypothetical protein